MNAVTADRTGIRQYEVYFGPSAMQPKTLAILTTLVELAIRVNDPNNLDRIARGAKDQIDF